MRKRDELQCRELETRTKLNQNLQTVDRTPELDTERDTLTAELTALAPELRAAIAADPDPVVTVTDTAVDAETRERAEIRSKTGIADYLKAALSGVEVRGAAAEFAAACKVATFQRLPLALFAQFAPAPKPETRAITPGPAVDGMVQQAIQFVFEKTAAASLGVIFTSHGPGKAQIPRVTTAPPADTLAKDGTAPSTAAAIALDSKEPERVSGQFEVRVEDLAVFPQLEAVLQESIRRSIANYMDEELISDLFTAATDVTREGNTVTFETGMALFAALVDGRHAYSYSDVRAIIGSATFASFDGKYQSNGDMSLSDRLMSKLGSYRVSDRVPNVTSNGQKALVCLGASGDPIRSYVWDALEIIRDPYSGAGTGKVTITATALLSSPYVPHGTSMLKELHPKIT